MLFDGDVIFMYGEIHTAWVKTFRDFIEQLVADRGDDRDRLVVFLNTAGGSVETVEKLVEIIRHHYGEVYFVVPDYAMSAGTIFCTSGDEIYMDYSSSLGPIDPQVWNGEAWVPALGYLDKVEELVQKAAAGTLTNAELMILQSQDLALLSRYEQAKDLTVTLLKKWLVEYKFRSWETHQTDPDKKGQTVTLEEKEKRAKEIADTLSDNKLWHSHNRQIGLNTLRDVVRLKIEDYTEMSELTEQIRVYNDLMTEFIARDNYSFFLHSRTFF